jgi:hypothetical protein
VAVPQTLCADAGIARSAPSLPALRDPDSLGSLTVNFTERVEIPVSVLPSVTLLSICERFTRRLLFFWDFVRGRADGIPRKMADDTSVCRGAARGEYDADGAAPCRDQGWF